MARKPAPLIAKATARIEANAFAKAVELLVEAWRGHRSARLALLVERCGRLANETVIPEVVFAPNQPMDERTRALQALPQDRRWSRLAIEHRGKAGAALADGAAQISVLRVAIKRSSRLIARWSTR